MKKQLTIKLEEGLWEHANRKQNKSAYVEELVRADVQGDRTVPIVETAKTAILDDEDFILKLALRMSALVGKNKQAPAEPTVVPIKEW